MFVVWAQGLGYRTGLGLKLGRTRTAHWVFFVQIGHDVGRFREHQLIVFEDWDVILAGDVVDLCAHPSHVGNDDINIGKLQVSQLPADHMTVRTPVDMEER